jgi:hypothetical protein
MTDTLFTFLNLVAWTVLIVFGCISVVTFLGTWWHVYSLEADPAYKAKWTLHRALGGKDIQPRFLPKLGLTTLAAIWLIAVHLNK